MTQGNAAGRKTDTRDDPFEAILLRQIGNCDASLERAFAAMAHHEQLSVEERWKAYQYVEFFVPERASLMRMVDGTTKLANAAARLRREASLGLKVTHEIAAGGKHRGTSKTAGSIPKENVANDAARVEAAE